MTATTSMAAQGRLREKEPAAPHSLFSLCSSLPRDGQKSFFPRTAMKNGTTVTNASSITAMPIATATADLYRMNLDKPMAAKPTNTARPE
ncbi:Uncharacterised protein [Actinobacillus pleuropneumoniae]|nr:Uncharacterised protein [Actinobacillus pleuropneumoniae]